MIGDELDVGNELGILCVSWPTGSDQGKATVTTVRAENMNRVALARHYSDRFEWASMYSTEI